MVGGSKNDKAIESCRRRPCPAARTRTRLFVSGLIKHDRAVAVVDVTHSSFSREGLVPTCNPALPVFPALRRYRWLRCRVGSDGTGRGAGESVVAKNIWFPGGYRYLYVDYKSGNVRTSGALACPLLGAGDERDGFAVGMRRVATAVLISSLPAQGAQAQISRMLFHNVRILDVVKGQFGAPIDVLVEGRRIAKIGDRITPSGPVKTIESGGRTLMPGMHVHLTFSALTMPQMLSPQHSLQERAMSMSSRSTRFGRGDVRRLG